jgi:hypothetical protein
MAQQTAAEGMRRLTTQLPADAARRLEKNAKANGRSVASEIRMAVDRWLDVHVPREETS